MSIGALLATPRSRWGCSAARSSRAAPGHHALTPATAGTSRPQSARGSAWRRRRRSPTKPAGGAGRACHRSAQLNPDPARWGEVAVNLMAFEPVVDGDCCPRCRSAASPAGPAGASTCSPAPTTDETALPRPQRRVDLATDDVAAGRGRRRTGCHAATRSATYRAGGPGRVPASRSSACDRLVLPHPGVPAGRGPPHRAPGDRSAPVRVRLALAATRRPAGRLPRARSRLRVRHAC